MSISERLADSLFVGIVQSLGGDIVEPICRAACDVGIELDPSTVPNFRLDTAAQYPSPAGALASGVIVHETRSSTVFVRPEVLAAHAESIHSTLGIETPDEKTAAKLGDYCVLQAMVDLTLQSTPNITAEARRTIHDQFTNNHF